MEETSWGSLPLVIGPSGQQRTLTSVVAVLGVIGSLVWAIAQLSGDGETVPTLLLLAVFALLFTAPTIAGAFSTRVVVTADAVTITGAPSRGTWKWSDLTEVCLTETPGTWHLALRPIGSTWDVPGPQSPAVTPLVFGNDSYYDAARNALKNICAEHHIPFTDSLDGLGSAPPGSQFRSDGA